MRRFSLSWQGGLWVMLLPYLVGTLLLVGLPALMSGALAFTTFDALSAPVFVGFTNFRLLAADPLVGTALYNSLWFILLAVPLRVLGAMGLAMLLFRPRRGATGYRAAVYTPTVLPDIAFEPFKKQSLGLFLAHTGYLLKRLLFLVDQLI